MNKNKIIFCLSFLLPTNAMAASLPSIIIWGPMLLFYAACSALYLTIYGFVLIRNKGFKTVQQVTLFNFFNITLLIILTWYIYGTRNWADSEYIILKTFVIAFELLQFYLMYKSVKIYLYNNLRSTDQTINGDPVVEETISKSNIPRLGAAFTYPIIGLIIFMPIFYLVSPSLFNVSTVVLLNMLIVTAIANSKIHHSLILKTKAEYLQYAILGAVIGIVSTGIIFLPALGLLCGVPIAIYYRWRIRNEIFEIKNN